MTTQQETDSANYGHFFTEALKTNNNDPVLAHAAVMRDNPGLAERMQAARSSRTTQIEQPSADAGAPDVAVQTEYEAEFRKSLAITNGDAVRAHTMTMTRCPNLAAKLRVKLPGVPCVKIPGVD